MNEGARVIIKPEVDASDQQIFAKNDFRTNAENMEMMLEQKKEGNSIAEIFRPVRFGDFSANIPFGMNYMMSDNREAVIADYGLGYIIDSEYNKERKRKYDEALK